MVTGYEVEYYANISSIAKSLNRIANCLEASEYRARSKDVPQVLEKTAQTETGAVTSPKDEE
jgi:hypothetical protein